MRSATSAAHNTGLSCISFICLRQYDKQEICHTMVVPGIFESHAQQSAYINEVLGLCTLHSSLTKVMELNVNKFCCAATRRTSICSTGSESASNTAAQSVSGQGCCTAASMLDFETVDHVHVFDVAAKYAKCCCTISLTATSAVHRFRCS